MSAPDALRKGWCPGALRPMAARDGLLVRLRLTGGILPAATARSLAACAEQHGNGLFDLSGRGNLQMRGVGAAALPALLGTLDALHLLDEDAGAEAVRNVVASPLAGLSSSVPDIRSIAVALEQRLAADTSLHALPGKVWFLIDDGGAPSLAGVAADVRFDWCADEGCFVIGLGSTRASAIAIGTCCPDALVESAARVASAAIRLFAEVPAHRMRQLVDRLGADEVARACGGELRVPPVRRAAVEPEIVGQLTFGTMPVLGLAVPFGRLDAAMLRHAADLADGGSSEIRLTPWRAILLPGVAPATLESARALGFIVEPRDPRRAVVACVGMDGCERGTTPTHVDAAALAEAAARLGDGGVMLHVSGCEKGCARPSATAVTLVGRSGRYDLVRDGRPGDAPLARGLDLAATGEALAATLAPA